MPNMISIGLKTYKLLRYHCGCHGKLVTIAMRYLADTYHTKKASYQIELNRTQDKEVIQVSL